MRSGILWTALFLLAGSALAEAPSESLRGKLIQQQGKPPAIELAGGKLIGLDGDEPTRGVLNDKRLASVDIDVKGRFRKPDVFVVDAIHTKAVHVHKDGKQLVVTYWCDVCSIRTYTPGICWCCQQETELDLREAEKE